MEWYAHVYGRIGSLFEGLGIDEHLFSGNQYDNE